MKKLTFALFPLLATGILLTFNNSKQWDGPYVLYKGGDVQVKYIIEENGARLVREETIPAAQRESITLKVATDEPGRFFDVPLKKKLQNEKSEHKKVNRMFVFSDIEGNFKAMRTLLQGNGVIDKDLKWSFGDGHVVLTGDFVDRGDLVTEVLWFIYALEEQAKEAGGYVHFILGNHEIMNMSDDLRYLNPKYVESAKLLNEHFMNLYGQNSELGRWLRTKNVAEKIGKFLFVHAGISNEVNQMNVSVNDINRLTRPYYGDTIYNYKDQRSDTLIGDAGPFWYRGYYSKSKPAPKEQVDQSLSKFGVKHIVIGHTLVADTVSLWYGGKVINVDTHHAQGHSEALLMEGDKLYRVNAAGHKVLLADK